MNYTNLRALIDANIKDNGNQEITGDILQQVLQAMVTALGAGYQYMGVATPAGNPTVDDSKVFWLATAAGTYTNYGGAVLTGDELVILLYGSGWTAVSTGIATSAFVAAQASGKAVLSDVMAALSGKASGRGENPALVAGSARTVLGRPASASPYTFINTDCGTGAIRITELRGRTIEVGGSLFGNDCKEIISRGRNQWDEQWEDGRIDLDTGLDVNTQHGLRSKNFIRIMGGEFYYFNKGAYTGDMYAVFYDYDKTILDGFAVGNAEVATPANAFFVRFFIEASAEVTAYGHDVCVNLSDSDFNGQYAPYFEDVLPLDPASWTSGGVQILPIGLNGIGGAYDRAIVDPDGVIRRVALSFARRAYQAGDEDDPNVVTDGWQYTVYNTGNVTYYTLDTPVAATFAAVTGGTIYFSPNADADVLYFSIIMAAEWPAEFARDFISQASFENFTLALEGELGVVIAWNWNATTQAWEFTIS